MPLRGEVVQPPIAKPETRKRVKGRKQRRAARVVKSVRAQCVERDGYCRVAAQFMDAKCEGVSEWAHLGDKRRFKTRGRAPESRHTTAGSLMLCTAHHRAYDQRRLAIVGEDADQPLSFVWLA